MPLRCNVCSHNSKARVCATSVWVARCPRPRRGKLSCPSLMRIQTWCDVGAAFAFDARCLRHDGVMPDGPGEYRGLDPIAVPARAPVAGSTKAQEVALKGSIQSSS